MTRAETDVWSAVYAAALGGMLSVAKRVMYPHQRPGMNADTNEGALSLAARSYADEAVRQYRIACGELGTAETT